MLDYGKIKVWAIDHKKEFILAGCFVIVFFVGFGTGKFDKDAKRKQQIEKTNLNYSKNQQTPQKNNLGGGELVPAVPEVLGTAEQVVEKQSPVVAQPLKTTTVTAKTEKCYIKGNIGSGGSKIYHMPGGAFYERTNPEMCFDTEAEAQTAGFRKSQR